MSWISARVVPGLPNSFIENLSEVPSKTAVPLWSFKSDKFKSTSSRNHPQ